MLTLFGQFQYKIYATIININEYFYKWSNFHYFINWFIHFKNELIKSAYLQVTNRFSIFSKQTACSRTCMIPYLSREIWSRPPKLNPRTSNRFEPKWSWFDRNLDHSSLGWVECTRRARTRSRPLKEWLWRPVTCSWPLRWLPCGFGACAFASPVDAGGGDGDAAAVAAARKIAPGQRTTMTATKSCCWACFLSSFFVSNGPVTRRNL